MKIRSIKTKLEATITEAEWTQMKARGDARKYVVISTAPARSAPPADTASADYNQLVKDATAAMKKKHLKKAKALFTKALAINATDMVKAKLAEIEDAESMAE